MYKKFADLGIVHKYKGVIAIGLVTRIALAVFIFPKLAENLYLPFFYSQSHPFDFSVIQNNLQSQETPFPYGLPMYIIFLPVFIAVKISASASFTVPVIIALGIISIIPDFLIMRILIKQNSDFKVLLLWVFSPIVLWSTYHAGQTDLWPALMLLGSCYLLLIKKRFRSSGALLGLAIGCKYGVAIVLPFILVFMLDNPRYKKLMSKYLVSALLVAFACYIPALYSSEFRQLILESEMKSQVLSLYIDFHGFQFYLVPVIYLLLLIWIYRAGRTTTTVLVIFLSVSIVSITVLTPAAFGWVIWSLPVLLVFLDIQTSRLVWVLGIFQALYFLSKSDIFEVIGYSMNSQALSILSTVLTVFTVFLLIRVLQHGVAQGDIYQLALKPFSVAIAGDSGVGKDSFAKSILSAFGDESTSVICGDDFHLYERGDFVWGSNSHLNPRMNNLHHWSQDISKAMRREQYKSKEYDHTNGRFSKTGVKKKSDLVISQGLHALYPEVSKNIDAKIFLEMETELRLLLKMQRDSTERNRTKEEVFGQLKTREPDYVKFIEKQRDESDLIIRFISDDNQKVRVVEISSSNENSIVKLMEISLLTYSPESLIHKEFTQNTSIMIDSSFVDAKSVEAILKHKLSSYDQFFPIEPRISSGVSGILQLVTFLLLEQRRGIGGGSDDRN
jgi:uridine kinase